MDQVDFASGTIDSIRSISQRALLSYWGRLANGGLVPFEEFEPSSRIHDPKQLAVWKVDAKVGQTHFRALYRGKLLDEAFNEGWAGKTLAEITPPSLRDPIISASNHCASTGCAVYTILRTYDNAGLAIDLERLLLPFGKAGRVQQIVASLQLISLKGVVDRPQVARSVEQKSECVLSIRIPAGGLDARRDGRQLTEMHDLLDIEEV
jgi:hypothetical protein